MIQNAEIKARSAAPEQVRAILLENGAVHKGTDLQTDIYFRVTEGRLKLRRGNIEHALIYYRRPNTAATRQSLIHLVPLTGDSSALEALLTAVHGVRCIVSKQRDIYFIDNVKFHIDAVEGLGHFVEIEAIGQPGAAAYEQLQQQCNHYMQLLQIAPSDLLTHSYSDMLCGTL
ncbi:MAG: class IV adenylate cyclase [Lacibacter sp.]|jgi:predicted adenylyl cyclase CyaB